MKFLKTTTILTNFLFLLCLVSCKNDGISNIGSADVVISGDGGQITQAQYRYIEYISMSAGADGEEDVLPNDKEKYLKTKVSKDGKTVEENLKDSIVEICKNSINMSKIFNERKLSFDEEENKKIDEKTEEYWKENEKAMQKIEVKKEDLKNYIEIDFKKMKIFESYYGENGDRPVKKDELKNFYENNNVKVSYLLRNLTKFSTDTEENQEESKLSEEEIEKTRKEFESYAKKIKDKEKTLADVYKDITGDNKENEEYQLSEEDSVISIGEQFPEALKQPLKNLKKDEVITVKSDELKIIFLFVGKDISEEFEKKFSDKEQKEEILFDFKNKEFDKILEDELNKINFSIKNDEIEKIGISYMYDKILEINKENPKPAKNSEESTQEIQD